MHFCLVSAQEWGARSPVCVRSSETGRQANFPKMGTRLLAYELPVARFGSASLFRSGHSGSYCHLFLMAIFFFHVTVTFLCACCTANTLLKKNLSYLVFSAGLSAVFSY